MSHAPPEALPFDREAITAAALRDNFRQLIHMRGMAFYGQVLTIFVVYYGLNLVVPVTSMLWVSAGLVAFNLVCLWRYRSHKPISESELFLGLCVDVIALSTQLALSGGASNPFVTLYLLPVIIACVLLRPAFAWGILALSLAFYALISLIPVSYPADAEAQMHVHVRPSQALFSLHTQGMMLAFAVAAVMLVVFVSRIRQTLSARDLKLAQLEQQRLEEAQVLRIGLLGAGAAHELGTPLTTLMVTLKDWRDFAPPGKKAERNAELDTLLSQVARCKAIVADILRSSGQAHAEGGGLKKLSVALRGLAESWRDGHRLTGMDIGVNLKADMDCVIDRGFEQAVFNLLDNALEASRRNGHDRVGFHVFSNEDTLFIDIRDQGPGLEPEVAARLGQAYVSTKPEDGQEHGLGLFLTLNILRQLGGSLIPMDNEDDRGCVIGTLMQVRLPLSAVRITQP